MGLLTLAAEEPARLTFGQELRGYLVVIFAIGLFCGSIYLLLATNIGARLGLLLAFVGTIFGYLKMDTATRGYYSGRLRFGAGIVLLAIVGGALVLAAIGFK